MHAEILAPVDACLPKDQAGNFIADQEKSDVVHDRPASAKQGVAAPNPPQKLLADTAAA